MATQYQVVCPKCKQPVAVAGSMAGKAVPCPKCGASFLFSGKAPGGSVSAAARSTTGGPAKAAATSTTGSGAKPAAAPPAGAPATVGQYQIRRVLGQGAFGVVYLAYHPFLDIEVAVKMLRAEALSSPQAVERFLREAKVLAKMEHPNVMRVYDAGKHGDEHFLASAYIAGSDLAALVPEGGLDPQRAAKLVVQMLRGLGYAHARGIVHRDVKPANARLGDNDTVYLMDFGLAGWLAQEQPPTPDGQDPRRMTRAGAVMGTPAYMPPEQASGLTDQVGPEADLYSAGVVLFELLTGNLPFDAPNLPALLYAVISTPPPPPSSLRPGLPPQLDAICLKAMAKRPEDRYRNAEEFEEALEDWLYTQPAGTAPPPPASRSSVAAAGAPTWAPAAPKGTAARLAAPTMIAPATPPAAAAPAPSRRLLFVGIAAVIGLLLVGAVIAFFAFKGKGASQTRPGFFKERDEFKH